MTPLDMLARYFHDEEFPTYKWESYPSEYERNYWRTKTKRFLLFLSDLPQLDIEMPLKIALHVILGKSHV